ncbi:MULTISPECIES: bifunctional diguanylate cyclase/phosphodiesterase [unclassified Ectothiorhodospira]|uniref:putative bifunctional diguanylate cyclase/phosphodiesterase n=1 Tax=unclassified Ectothiorhodospira TaxID=2684909 RepID=UPI001EE8ECAC|nr:MULTISPECIES: EAL domain-containing protein [unclassified Ectothiorhodospira]MCG5516830.1 EAL domain-containing protein [Ectothiorhodospira sp. 9100]MCG5519814.1 EAL domain-containing protein [Ectothiorhodospira sp. 9905]
MEGLGLRISLAIAIPVVAFLLMAVLALGGRQDDARHMEHILATASLAREANVLIHALQAERGSSAGYLSGFDDGFLTLLQTARSETDQAMERFREQMSRVAPTGSSPIADLARTLGHELDALETHRRRVDGHRLEPLQVLPPYSNVIRHLILVASHMPHRQSTAEMPALIHAYRPLLLLKEHAGLERALGSAWLDSARHDRNVFYRYSSNLAIQDQQRSHFLALAPVAYGNTLLELESRADHRALMEARAAIINHGAASRPQHLDAVEWFRITSARVDALRDMELRLSEQIMETARMAREESRQRLALWTFLTLLLMAVTIGLSLLVARDLVQRYRQHQEAMEQTAYMVRHDPLTGLPNRAHFHEQLEARLAKARAHQLPLCLYLMDLAGFAELNRIWGDAVADHVLKRVAQRLSELAGPEVLTARVYGDQFALVVFKDSRLSDIKGFGCDLLSTLDEPFQVGERRIEVAAHLGVVSCPAYPDHASQLLAHAGFAVAHAKATLGQRMCLFEPGLLARHTEAVELDQDLDQALVQGQFELHYQPKVALESGRIVSFEALLRWQHPSRGWVPPGQFIPRAEASGSIIAIGDLVLREACRQARRWRDAGWPDLTVAVNLSTVQLYQADLMARVQWALSEAGLPAEALELELTETGLMEDMDAAADILEHLRALGVRLSVDDFGTGYSSLAYLRRFPVHALKLDARFVKDLESSDEAEMIANAVLALAESLSLDCVAEGVETEAQADWLRARGCGQAQGYLFARPMPADQCESLLAHEYVTRS